MLTLKFTKYKHIYTYFQCEREIIDPSEKWDCIQIQKKYKKEISLELAKFYIYNFFAIAHKKKLFLLLFLGNNINTTVKPMTLDSGGTKQTTKSGSKHLERLDTAVLHVVVPRFFFFFFFAKLIKLIALMKWNFFKSARDFSSLARDCVRKAKWEREKKPPKWDSKKEKKEKMVKVTYN